jgi:hypothetical protein
LTPWRSSLLQCLHKGQPVKMRTTPSALT